MIIIFLVLKQKALKSLVGDAKNVAESAKKVEDVTSFLKKGLSAKADVKNVMNVVSVSKACNASLFICYWAFYFSFFDVILFIVFKDVFSLRRLFSLTLFLSQSLSLSRSYFFNIFYFSPAHNLILSLSLSLSLALLFSLSFSHNTHSDRADIGFLTGALRKSYEYAEKLKYAYDNIVNRVHRIMNINHELIMYINHEQIMNIMN